METPVSQAAVDTWNKLCFTGGYLEVGLLLPEEVLSEKVQVNVRLVGNLYRYNHVQGLSDVAYFSYDTCKGSGKVMWGGYDAQRWSACGPESGQ